MLFLIHNRHTYHLLQGFGVPVPAAEPAGAFRPGRGAPHARPLAAAAQLFLPLSPHPHLTWLRRRRQRQQQLKPVQLQTERCQGDMEAPAHPGAAAAAAAMAGGGSQRRRRKREREPQVDGHSDGHSLCKRQAKQWLTWAAAGSSQILLDGRVCLTCTLFFRFQGGHTRTVMRLECSVLLRRRPRRLLCNPAVKLKQ